MLHLVVASFTEIKTGYRGFETNEIRYIRYACYWQWLFLYMNQNLQLEMAFERY